MGIFREIFVFVIIGVTACAFARGEAVPLFQPTDANGARSAGLVINQAAVAQLRSETGDVNLGAVPLITGESGSFRLTPMPIFAKNATIQVIQANGTTTTVSAPDVRTWYGEDVDHPDRALFVAAAPNGEVRAMITGDAQTSVTVISRDKAAGAGVYRIERAVLPERNLCDSMEVPPELRDAIQQNSNAVTTTRAGRNNITYEIELMIDVGYVLYKNFDFDASATLDYITELFGAVNAIYERDLKAHFTLIHVTMWSMPDPVSAKPATEDVSTFSQIRNYRNYVNLYRTNVPYDLAHFIDGLPLGGRAYLDVIQSYARGVRSGVSNVYGTGEFPTDGSWYWDTTVVAHELGHNVGSPHTMCYKPPIDCCAIECPECTVEKPTLGTIMSYCHLQIGNGGGIDMRFHERCIDLMRRRIETSLILSPYSPKAEIEIRGSEGTLIPANATDTIRSTLFRSNGVGVSANNSFQIRNMGGEALQLTGNPKVVLLKAPTPTQKITDTLEPLASNEFTITSQPAPSSLDPGDTTMFSIRYNPTNDEEKWAVVEVRNSDADEGVYRFLIKGRLIQPSNPFVGTFNGNVTIPEQGGTWTVVPVVVEDVPGLITSVQVEFGGSDCAIDSKTGIEHSWIGDLTIMLESPEGTTMTLMENVNTTTDTPAGAGGKNFCHTVLSDDGASPIQNVTAEEAPYSGTYSPKDSLATFIGGLPNGTWRFWFYDRAQPDQGVVHQISLTIRGDSAEELSKNSGPVNTPAENWRMFH